MKEFCVQKWRKKLYQLQTLQAEHDSGSAYARCRQENESADWGRGGEAEENN